MDFDAMLDQALDDFDEQELLKRVQELPVLGSSNEIAAEVDAEAMRQQIDLHKMMASLQDPSYGPVLQKTLKQLSGCAGGQETVESLFDQLAKQFDTNLKPSFLPDGPHDGVGVMSTDRELAATMQMIGSAQGDMTGVEAAKMEAAGESMMEEMMAQFEALGEKEDYGEVVDGVMRQLLSKDMMYEPTKQVCQKFPEWLAIHKKNLTEAEYNNYGRQYQSFQKILAVYDTEPDNFPRLIELMFDMQQYGQPPADLIRDLAPGLTFDENGEISPNCENNYIYKFSSLFFRRIACYRHGIGMPLLPNMGTGIGELPNLGQTAQDMEQGQCVVH